MTKPLDAFCRHRAELGRALKEKLASATEWDGSPLRVSHPPFAISLDVHAEAAGYSSEVVTRLRAAFVNRDGFTFRIRRRTALTPLAKLMGMQDIEIGDEAFDHEYVLQANRPEELRRLLSSAELRREILDADVELIEVRPDEGWFGPEFPEGVDELYLEVPGRVTDRAKIEKLYDLFADLLDRLCQIGSAYERNPNLEL